MFAFATIVTIALLCRRTRCDQITWALTEHGTWVPTNTRDHSQAQSSMLSLVLVFIHVVQAALSQKALHLIPAVTLLSARLVLFFLV